MEKQTSKLHSPTAATGASASDMKREYELNNIKELEDGLVSLTEPQVSRFYHSEFLRVGLPILSGLLDNTFNPERWEEFVGNQYVGLEILDDHNGEVRYVLPPLLRQGPTVINDDPNRESLTAESQHLLNIRDIDPTEASARLLVVAEESLQRQNGDLEYSTASVARATIDSLNIIFKANNLGQLDMPEGLENVKTPATSAPATEAKVAAKAESYDFNQGEDF